MLDSYTQGKVEELKGLMRATGLHYDRVGITLTIDGQLLFIPHDAVRAMSHLLSSHEQEEVNRLRREMAAEQGRVY